MIMRLNKHLVCQERLVRLPLFAVEMYCYNTILYSQLGISQHLLSDHNSICATQRRVESAIAVSRDEGEVKPSQFIIVRHLLIVWGLGACGLNVHVRAHARVHLNIITETCSCFFPTVVVWKSKWSQNLTSLMMIPLHIT